MNVKEIFLFIALLYVGSASAQEHEPVESVYSENNYGAPIDPAKAIEIAERSIKAQMKDPYSAVFEWKEMFQGYLRAAGPGSYTYYGYVLEGTVNGKNSYGGYVGAKRVLMLFQDGVPRLGKWEQTVGYGRYQQTGMVEFPIR